MHRWHKISSLLVILAILLSGIPTPVLAINVSSVTVTVATDPYLVLDSNKPCTQGPNTAYVGYTIRNTTSTTLNKLTATLGNTGNGFVLGGGQVATQQIGTLDAGASSTLYWLLQYPCSAGKRQVLSLTVNDDSNQPATISRAAVTPLPASPSLSDFGTEVVTSSTISANAGGMVVASAIDSVAVVGGSLRADVTYSFGSIAVNDRFNMQPSGMTGFNAGCFQLLGSEILQSELNKCKGDCWHARSLVLFGE